MASRVAVMVDDEVLRTLFCEIIELNGYEPAVLFPPDQALAQLALRATDALILDVRLMDKDPGWDLLDAIRHEPSIAALPVILLTADADRRRNKRQTGINTDCHLLRKPFGFVEISSVLAAVLGEQ
jgi:CheY-like chemotaxis protein